MVIAILIIAGVGLVAAVALAIADKYLSVSEDPRIGMVTAALPGANCGGCGFAGCDGYARALVAGTAPRRRRPRSALRSSSAAARGRRQFASATTTASATARWRR